MYPATNDNRITYIMEHLHQPGSLADRNEPVTPLPARLEKNWPRRLQTKVYLHRPAVID